MGCSSVYVYILLLWDMVDFQTTVVSFLSEATHGVVVVL